MKKLLIAYFFLICTVTFGKSTESAKADTSAIVLKRDSKTLPVNKTMHKPNRFLVNEIVCKVNGPEREQIFCSSEIARAGLAGAGQGNLKEIITNELIYQDALHLKLPISESVIDNYIGSIQQQHNLSMKDVEKIFKASGRTLEEGREELRIMYAVNSMTEMKIKTNLVIPEHEVIAYYNAHPIKKEARFQIQRASVPIQQDDDIKELEKKLQVFAKKGTGFEVVWGEPIWFVESDLAEKIKFITTMNEGEICKPLPMAGGFEMYKLLKKKPEKLVPLKKRYRDIVEELRKPKFEQMFAKYSKELMDSASITYFNQPAVAA